MEILRRCLPPSFLNKWYTELKWKDVFADLVIYLITNKITEKYVCFTARKNHEQASTIYALKYNWAERYLVTLTNGTSHTNNAGV